MGIAVRKSAQVVVLLASLFALGGCGENHEWRQRTTVTVETPQGPVSGSSVVKIGWRKNDSLGAANGPAWIYGPRGESVVVSLDAGRYLFALVMKDEYAGNIAGQVLFDKDGRVWGTDKFTAVRAHQGAIDVPLSRAPLLVTFDDINDPKSVKLVDPANLAATFGPGFALMSITIEVTDEKVTEDKVEKVLAWLCDYKARGARLNGSTSIGISDNELSNRTGTGSFMRGECR